MAANTAHLNSLLLARHPGRPDEPARSYRAARGLEAASRIIALAAGTRILISTRVSRESSKMSEGIPLPDGFVQKSQAARDLILAVERLLAGGTFFAGEPNELGTKKSDKPASAAKAAPNSGVTFCSVFSFA